MHAGGLRGADQARRRRYRRQQRGGSRPQPYRGHARRRAAEVGARYCHRLPL